MYVHKKEFPAETGLNRHDRRRQDKLLKVRAKKAAKATYAKVIKRILKLRGVPVDGKSA